MIHSDATPPTDKVMLSLGLAEGKSWPEDAAEPGPHYWRVPRPDDRLWPTATVHMVDCHLALRSPRRLAWFGADGVLPFRLLARMDRRPWLVPCRVCWYWHLKTVEVLGMRAALLLTDVAESER